MEYINMDKRFKISKTLILNFLFLVLLLITTISRPIDGFGFDSANSCTVQTSKLSRRGRAQILAAIPCDLTRQAYCHLPGSAYPWHAVRRFVHENHGLMKRMYGDVRHISVLRDEILYNEIDVDDVEDAAERYSKEPHRARAAKYMHGEEEQYAGNKNKDVLLEPHFRPVSTTTSTTAIPEMEKEGNTAGPNEKVEAKLEEEQPLKPAGGSTLRRRTNMSFNGSGHRRRINVYLNRNRPTHSSLRRRTTTTTTTTTTTEEPKYLVENAVTSGETVLHEETILEIPEDDGNLASNSVYEVPTSPAMTLHMGDNIQIIESPKLGQLQKPFTEYKNNSESATISTTLKVVTTPTAEFSEAPGSPTPVEPTLLQQNPLYLMEPSQQKPTHNLKLQQVNALTPIFVEGDGKESTTIKSKPLNESADTQSAATLTPTDSSTSAQQQSNTAANDDADITTDTDNDTTLSNSGGATSADMDVTASATATAISKEPLAALAAQLNNQKQQQNAENKAESPPLTVLSEQTAPTTATTKLTSTQAELSSAAKATIAPTHAVASAGEKEEQAHVELLTDERIQSPPSTRPQQPPQPAPPQTSPTTPAAAGASTKPVLRDGQLYQDALKQEVKPGPNMRGINACPVKEEVVAPFWANNTRGEVLALLNVYPFEQYVHWEKCTQENRQMYCRDGCRCEQQYRLHRLLAYDPHNECRGIFSDWFRFPSCCICKCYGMPMEFRATSRSPRSERMDDFEAMVDETGFVDDGTVSDEEFVESQEEQQSQHPIDVAEQLVRQAIYEHATEDWYRPKEEFDFYEG